MRQGKYARTTERSLSSVGAQLLKRIKLPAESISVSCIGWQMGEVIMTDRPSFSNQQINTIVPNKMVEPSFLYYSLRPRKQELLALGTMAGVRTPILNKSAFSNLKVQLPSIPIQQRIAGILSAYDELIENSQLRIKILESITRALYREWFVHLRFPGHDSVPRIPSPLGEIPQGWELKRIDNALRFDSGRTIKKEERENGKTPVYGANGIIGVTTNPAMADKGIIMGKIGSCGALHRSHLPCWVTNNAFLVQPAAIQSWELAWQLLLHIDFQQYVGGAANPYMPINAFGQHEVLVPSVSVQCEFQEKAAPIRSLIEILALKVENLRRTRDILIPRLLSGQIEMEAIPA